LYYSEKLAKLIKAKDQYGPVISIVEKRKRELAQEGITDIHPEEVDGISSSGGEKGDQSGAAKKAASENSLALYS